ncbi:MAG: response regulator, partial [Gammaproteobacteria bacterium]|nr:response regulator [Gammaproteobacteria bacterium]
SAIARKMAANILNDNGYEVVQARDGFDALGKLENENPDLIMLDLIMPGIDGYKVVDLLKKNKKYQNLPIILVTSKDSLMDKLKGKMSNTDAYITKPFKDEQLLKVIDQLLKK